MLELFFLHVVPPSVIFSTGSRLEDLLEKSYVAHSFGSTSSKRRRTHLDAVLAGVSPDDEEGEQAASPADAETT